MSKKTLVIVLALFLAVLLGSAFLYLNLSEEMEPGGMPIDPPRRETTPVSESIPDGEPTIPDNTEGQNQTEVPDYSAPDFTMLDSEGNEVNLRDFVGKPMILNFWASWCGPCKMEMPDIEKAYRQYGEEIHFLIVNCTDGSRETVDNAKEFIEGEGYTFPVYFDTTSMGAYTYGASSIPLTFFIDSEGNLVTYYIGAMSESILKQGIDMIYTPAE